MGSIHSKLVTMADKINSQLTGEERDDGAPVLTVSVPIEPLQNCTEDGDEAMLPDLSRMDMDCSGGENWMVSDPSVSAEVEVYSGPMAEETDLSEEEMEAASKSVYIFNEPIIKLARCDPMLQRILSRPPPPTPSKRPDSGVGVGSPKAKIRRVEGDVSGTFPRFLKLVGKLLDAVKNHGLDQEDDEDSEFVSSNQLLFSKSQLMELCSETANLKAIGEMDKVPIDMIVKILSILEKNILDGCEMRWKPDDVKEYEVDDKDDEKLQGRETTMERLLRGALSSHIVLNILTSPNMPKRVYLEGVIDGVVGFTKFHLQNTIFPAFDPVYKVKPDAKESLSSPSKKKKKTGSATRVKDKNILYFYNKLHEVVGLLAELLLIQVLPDSTVLQLSSLGVAPFFVENMPQLQLSALKLVTGIFTTYVQHRTLLLDDILASVARLPTSKRNLRTFKLSSGESIQMLTALVLQLIQCVTCLPDQLAEHDSKKLIDPEKDLLINDKFDNAVNVAGHFISVFLNKCGSKSEDACDYRLLFENFLQDLLSTVNKPEWPASELSLLLLGNLLVKRLGNKELDVPIRVTSLEYLGIAAARLRKDTVGAQCKMETINRIIKNIKQGEAEDGNYAEFGSEDEKTEFIQRILLDYLAVEANSDPVLLHARHFYIASWWKGVGREIERHKSLSRNRAKMRKKSESNSEDEETDEDVNVKIGKLTESRKQFLLCNINPFSQQNTTRKTDVIKTYVDHQTAELLTRYLASTKPFSARFDFFLTRILSFSMETIVTIRSKALRCLTMVVEADPTVLARSDMQTWVHNSFVDQSISVREAAVELIGKYVLSGPDLIDKYYDKLSLRILDSGVSVRKRVIKILRDVCTQCPHFPKIPEICIKMIRRVNDEDGVRKLVMQIFQNMWLTPVLGNDDKSDRLLQKVLNIADVVSSSEKVGLDFLEQLLASLFRPKDVGGGEKDDVRGRRKITDLEPPAAVLTASKEIVDCLVKKVLCLEEEASKSSMPSSRFVACICTLLLFAKVRPQLLTKHCITLAGYLSLRCQNTADLQAVGNIASILELVVPLLLNPSDSFLAQLEEDCTKLIFKNERSVIEACMACLSAVVTKLTGNYNLVKDCFRKLHAMLTSQIKIMRENSSDPLLSQYRPQLRRAVYTIGLFCRYFDFTSAELCGHDFPADTVHQIFLELLYLVEGPLKDLQYLGIQAVGNLCVRHCDFMLGPQLKAVYQRLLSSTSSTSAIENRLKIQTLANIQLYLVEEDQQLMRQDSAWTKIDDLKGISSDLTAGMASTIIQLYLKEILEAYLHPNLGVRRSAIGVIQLVLQQGLVHPIPIVPYLICMSTDEDLSIASAADKQLQETGKRYPQLLQGQGLNGIRKSLEFRRILAGGFSSTSKMKVVRGYRKQVEGGAPAALNGFLYSLLRSTKPGRRGVALSLLKQFDDNHHDNLTDLLYFADALAHFPYQVVDEPLFIIHRVDIIISVNGSNILQAFKESLLPVLKSEDSDEMDVDDDDDDEEEEEDEAVESLVSRITEGNMTTFENCIAASQGCLLLLNLKQHLKDIYGLSDTRIRDYSPSDSTKAFEKPVHRKSSKHGLQFKPKETLNYLNSQSSNSTSDSSTDRKKVLVEYYLHFKQLMLSLDPEEDDEEDGGVSC